MTFSLLPPDFDELIASAVRLFWRSREQGTSAQGGSRGYVLAGKNMDGFLHVLQAIVKHCGLLDSCVFTKGRGTLTLPGYFRPTKMWDALVVHDNRLLAAFEFKSQVGSFGNNINNRTEEALGSATDFQLAKEHQLYDPTNSAQTTEAEEEHLQLDPRPPFVGYLMLLQDCEASTSPKKSNSSHFRISPDFKSTSYSDRYKILCEKMMHQGLYDAAAVVLSEKEGGAETDTWRTLSSATDVRSLFTMFAGRILAEVTYSTTT